MDISFILLFKHVVAPKGAVWGQTGNMTWGAVTLLLLCLLGQENSLDVRQDTSLGNGDT